MCNDVWQVCCVCRVRCDRACVLCSTTKRRNCHNLAPSSPALRYAYGQSSSSPSSRFIVVSAAFASSSGVGITISITGLGFHGGNGKDSLMKESKKKVNCCNELDPDGGKPNPRMSLCTSPGSMGSSVSERCCRMAFRSCAFLYLEEAKPHICIARFFSFSFHLVKCFLPSGCCSKRAICCLDVMPYMSQTGGNKDIWATPAM